MTTNDTNLYTARQRQYLLSRVQSEHAADSLAIVLNRPAHVIFDSITGFNHVVLDEDRDMWNDERYRIVYSTDPIRAFNLRYAIEHGLIDRLPTFSEPAPAWGCEPWPEAA